MNVEQTIRENFSEIEAVASEVGIDFSKAQYLVDGRDKWKNKNIPFLDKKDKGRLSLNSNILGNSLIITFCNKRGHMSASWSSGKDQVIRLMPKRRIRTASPKKKWYKKETFEVFNKKYDECDEWTDSSHYMVKKGLVGRVKFKRMKDWAGEFIAVPMYNVYGEIKSFQKIYDNGRKRFISAPKTGLFYPTSELSQETEVIVVGEGVATVFDAAEAWDKKAVGVAAFDCQSIHSVVKRLRGAYPDARIVIAADNDIGKKSGNAGMLAALEASYLLKVSVRYPIALNEGDPVTDFNDVKSTYGKEELERQMKKNVLRISRSAFDFNLRALAFSGEEKSPNFKKRMRKIVGIAIRNGMGIDEMIEAIGVEDPDVIDTYYSIMKGHEKRVGRFHQVTKGKYEYANYESIDLKREDHGGYTITDEAAEQIARTKGIVILGTPMGSSKTEKVIKRIFNLFTFAAYLCHRVGLAEEASHRLEINCYRKLDEMQMVLVKKVASCVNSINNVLFGEGSYFQGLECVAIDEISKVLDHICGKTVEDQEGILATVKKMLASTPQILLADADASDHLIEQIHELAPDRKITVFNPTEAPMDHVQVKLCSNKDAGMEYVERLALEKKKVLVAMDSKIQSENLARICKKKGLKVLCVTSETKSFCSKVGSWVINPSQESKKYDVVIYTSAVDSGVSVVSDHFDETVGIFRGVITPDSIIQMMGRNRKAKQWFLVCEPFRHTVFGNSRTEKADAAKLSSIKTSLEAGNKPVSVPSLTDLDKLMISSEHRNQKLKQDYFVSLQVMLEQKGYNVNRVERPKDMLKKIKESLKDANSDRVQESVETILATEAPEESDYIRLKSQYTITEEQAWKIKRFEVENSLGKTDLSSDDVLFSLDNGGRRELIFELLHTDQKDLLEYDKYEQKKFVSAKKRRHLFIKGEILKNLFEALDLDMETGEGTFTHHKARKFIEYIQSNDKRRVVWNELNLGPYLGKNSEPYCATTFVKAIFKKMGLKTESQKRTRKKHSYQSIIPESWETMMDYKASRSLSGKNVAKIPKSELDKLDREPKASATPENEENSLIKNGGNYGVDICILCNAHVGNKAQILTNGKCSECVKMFKRLGHKRSG
ncbi:MAG: plasmid replication protein, CyRepA1 family [Oligoflexales bacterium]